MSRLNWTPSARNDPRLFDNWITREVSPTLALRVVTAIRAKALKLNNFPHLGRPHRGGVRILRVLHMTYLIRCRLKAGRVELLRLQHAREDWHIEP